MRNQATLTLVLAVIAAIAAAGCNDRPDRKRSRSAPPEVSFTGLGAPRTVKALNPRPDNIFLITDGLPTQGKEPPRGRTVSGRARLRHFNNSLEELPAGVPVNVVLMPIEGDAQAATEFWRLAQATQGSFISPSRDWP